MEPWMENLIVMRLYAVLASLTMPTLFLASITGYSSRLCEIADPNVYYGGNKQFDDPFLEEMATELTGLEDNWSNLGSDEATSRAHRTKTCQRIEACGPKSLGRFAF
jgi:hypothetical protein